MKKLIFIGYTVLLTAVVSAQDSVKPSTRNLFFPSYSDSNASVVYEGFISDSVIKSKVDSAVTVAAPSDTKVGPVKLPTWVLSFITAFLAAWPLVQFILKRIPTANSIKIQGVLGSVLDALTFFQPDKSINIRPTAPPPVQNGVEAPTMKDLSNHK